MRDVKQERMEAMFNMAERGGTENEREQARKWIETKTGQAYSEAVKGRAGKAQGPSVRPRTYADVMQDWIDNLRRAKESAGFRNPDFEIPFDSNPFPGFRPSSWTPRPKEYTAEDWGPRGKREYRSTGPGSVKYTFDSYHQWAHETLPFGITPGPLFVTDHTGKYHRMDDEKKARYEKWKAHAVEFGLEFVGEDRRDY
jgi:hypothetical protein